MDKPTEPQESQAKTVFVKPELRVLDVKSAEGGASPDVMEALGALS